MGDISQTHFTAQEPCFTGLLRVTENAEKTFLFVPRSSRDKENNYFLCGLRVSAVEVKNLFLIKTLFQN